MNDFIDDDLIDERNGEEPLDPTLAALARDYHAPPLTPREEIWAAIERSRERPAPVRPLRAGRRIIRWIPIAAGIAALLALAFAFGRFSSPAVVPAIAERTTPTDSQGPAAPPAGDPATLAADEPGEELFDPEPEVGGRGVRVSSYSRQADLPRPEPRDPRPPRTAAGQGAIPDAYDVVAARHLSRSEVFLTLFRDALRGEEPAELSPGTARQLLVRNRLLLDSPAAQDPRMRRLLEDLELVLVQIAQLPADEPRADTDLIADGMEAGDVLTRLRSATSTGVAATLRQGAL